MNECMLCFGTICEPICLFSVICLETNGEKKTQFYTGLKKNDVCQYSKGIGYTKIYYKNYIFESFLFAECIYNHIDTLLKFMTCFMQKNNHLLNNSNYFKTIESYQLLPTTGIYVDIINLPQMLSTFYMCALLQAAGSG